MLKKLLFDGGFAIHIGDLAKLIFIIDFKMCI